MRPWSSSRAWATRTRRSGTWLAAPEYREPRSMSCSPTRRPAFSSRTTSSPDSWRLAWRRDSPERVSRSGARRSCAGLSTTHAPSPRRSASSPRGVTRRSGCARTPRPPRGASSRISSNHLLAVRGSGLSRSRAGMGPARRDAPPARHADERGVTPSPSDRRGARELDRALPSASARRSVGS